MIFVGWMPLVTPASSASTKAAVESLYVRALLTAVSMNDIVIASHQAHRTRQKRLVISCHCCAFIVNVIIDRHCSISALTLLIV